MGITVGDGTDVGDQGRFDENQPAEDSSLRSAPVRGNFQATKRANDLRLVADDSGSTQNNDIAVYIEPGVYTFDGREMFFHPGGDWAPSWNFPSSGNRVDLIGFSSSNPETLTKIAGAENDPPSIPKDLVPIAFVKLTSTQSITPDSVFDVRSINEAAIVDYDNLSDNLQSQLNA